MKREDFSIDSAFSVIVTNNNDFFDSRSLVRFFRRNGFYSSPEEVGAIVRRLDLNYDEVITKEELAKFIVNASKLCYAAPESNEKSSNVVLIRQSSSSHGSKGKKKVSSRSEARLSVIAE